MSTFVDAVNRVLRLEGILRGDDDTISDFTSTQHSSSIEFAKIALQTELADVTQSHKLPIEQGNSTITLVAATRTYELPTNFRRFTDESRLWKVVNSEVVGAFIALNEEAMLRRNVPSYETQPGSPSWFYFTAATTMSIALYPVPDASVSGDIYKFWYDKAQTLSVETDSVPLITSEQFNAFCDIAGRRFKFLRLAPDERNALFPSGIERDPVLESKRSLLARLLRMNNPTDRYGRRYG